MSLVGDGVDGEGRAWAKEKAGIKERWRDINSALTELKDTQCAWTIPDAALRANMKDAICEDFLPIYKVCPPRFCRPPPPTHRAVSLSPSTTMSGM
jgi:hypothetical protein